MIDDATSPLTARFVRHDSTEENLEQLRRYVEQQGRPVAVYTDTASLFQIAPRAIHHRDAPEQPLSQIGRALEELNVEWIAAHSPQAKGRIERLFKTAQDRLVKGLRRVGAKDLETANAYREQVFLPLWNERFRYPPLTCDSDGNIYLQSEQHGVSGVRKINPKGQRVALFQPNANPDLKIDLVGYFALKDYALRLCLQVRRNVQISHQAATGFCLAARETRMKVVDLEGHEIATYDAVRVEGKPKLEPIGEAFACYTADPGRFVFLSAGDDNNLQFLVAEPR
jgi:hypothetical protein